MSTVRKIAPKQPSVSSFYTWTFPGAPVCVHLDFSVVDGLGRQVRRTFDLGGSSEIGGLLLGSVCSHGSIVEIKDFEPLQCRGRPDQRFVLAGSERGQLEKKLAAHKSAHDGALEVVGYYRSHMGQGLSLREQDLSLAQEYFGDPANVFLLIKPSSDGTLSGGFFFWDNGRIDSEFTFLEFSFDADQLAAAGPIDELSPADLEASLMPALSEEMTSEVWPASRMAHLRVKALRRLAGTPLLLACALYRQMCSQVRQAKAVCRRPALGVSIILAGLGALMVTLASLNHSASRSSAAGAPGLGLQVERRFNDLLVSWSRETPLVLHAREGVLSIRDGNLHRQELHLDLEQLRNGSVVYSPTSANVQFQLEVTASDNRETSETVLAVNAPKADLSSRVAARNRSKSVAQPMSRPPLSAKISTPFVGLPPRVASTPPQDFALLGQLALSQGELAALPSPPPQRSASRGTADAPQPDATLSSEQGQIAASPSFIAPRAIRESPLKLAPEIRAALTSEAEVQVKVKIDELGRVVSAEPVAVRGPASSSLVIATQRAARLWRFAPATLGNQAVASEAVLKFTFRPEIVCNSATGSR